MDSPLEQEKNFGLENFQNEFIYLFQYPEESDELQIAEGIIDSSLKVKIENNSNPLIKLKFLLNQDLCWKKKKY